MKKLFTLTLLLFSFFAKADYWTQKANFPGSNRFGCFSFSIGYKGYVGCGYDTTWGLAQTFWEYNQSTNSWTQKADFTGAARVYAAGFAINNMGYAGIGVSPAGGWFQDFWQYNPATNVWSAIADFGGGPRSEAVSFVVNAKAYVGTGTGTAAPYTFDDLWQYDPLTNIWTAKASLPGSARIKALGFSTANYGYITTGYAGSIYYNDIWQYDPVTDSWLQKLPFAFDARGSAAGLVLYGNLFLGTGVNHPLSGANYTSKDWNKFDAALNQWSPKISFAGFPRYDASYFAANNKGYVGMGVNGNIQYADMWEYTPDIPSGIDPSEQNSLLYAVYPNPAKDYIYIHAGHLTGKYIYITIKDISGKTVYKQEIDNALRNLQLKINLHNLIDGLYFITSGCGSGSNAGQPNQLVTRFLKHQ